MGNNSSLKGATKVETMIKSTDIVMWSSSMFVDIGIVIKLIDDDSHWDGSDQVLVMFSCGTLMPIRKKLLKKVA